MNERVTAESVRADVRAWVRAHWDPAMTLVQWRTALLDAGWAVPSWPERWFGKGLPAWADDVVRREIAACGAVSSVPSGLAGPTILEQGPDSTRERFLRPMLTGEEVWCQLFSEPSAGSDLAGLTTTAVLDGDEWVLNGQKVWNTSAHHADLGMLVARTNWDAPKHQGITYFVLPMHQPGVEVRPLRQMNFHSSFNEVFLTDARIPRDWVVGAVNQGWSAALATLAHERRFGVAVTVDRHPVDPGPAAEQAAAEAGETLKVYSWYPQRAGRADLAVPHARSAGLAGDPVVRQEIARLLSLQRVSQWTAERAKSNRALGRPPGPEGSIGKLAISHVARQAARVHSRLGGAHSMLAGTDPHAPLDGLLAEILMSVPAQSIAGGTDEIQRNILGEKALGLPKEPDPGKDLPYREARNR
ncbi:MAG: acyl-CoA dehydrogenase family protein [Acidimicrobiaceae bacterium]|nr:acyl-CoA dehydrogenase family protein [Acidimicrobiaceae bacterium]MCO5328779.1 acyl-CoA dehydrogenase family protein [Ilumatobacteraceae bacterium]